jgi:hypothetical protein
MSKYVPPKGAVDFFFFVLIFFILFNVGIPRVLWFREECPRILKLACVSVVSANRCAIYYAGPVSIL